MHLFDGSVQDLPQDGQRDLNWSVACVDLDPKRFVLLVCQYGNKQMLATIYRC